MHRILAALGLAVLPLGLPAVASAQVQTTAPVAPVAPVTLTLPAPSGPDRVGTVALHLIDPSRTDPWAPGNPVRELMVSIWYPATDTARYPTAPWMLPGAGAHFLADLGIPAGVVDLPQTAASEGAPVERRGGGRPVLLYSPGLGSDRTIDTTLVQDLASHGYIVVTIDSTHDSPEVEFPGGRIEVSMLPPSSLALFNQVVSVRDADARFVLDELTAIHHGANPDVEHAALPRGIAGSMDLSRIGMFGWSIGGATAAQTMLDDPRIKAGANMDGTFYGPVVTAGLNRPFLLFSSQGHNRDSDPTWASFWANLRGYRLDLTLDGAAHESFSDAEVLYPQVAPVLGLTPAQLAQEIGTIDPAHAVSDEDAYLEAFFDQELQHHDSTLLDGPSPSYPEVEFVR